MGNVFNQISLPLIKASLVDDILSLRYKNEIGNMLDSLYLVSSYTSQLEKENYTLIYQSNNKMIYTADDYRVIKMKKRILILIILFLGLVALGFLIFFNKSIIKDYSTKDFTIKYDNTWKIIEDNDNLKLRHKK